MHKSQTISRIKVEVAFVKKPSSRILILITNSKLKETFFHLMLRPNIVYHKRTLLYISLNKF